MLIRADARQIPLRAESVQCCVTSPPYWGLRDYGTPGQIGLERTPEEYVATMAQVFREVWRVLRPDGVLFLNLGDSYATFAGRAFSPGGGSQGERFRAMGAQVPDSKNPNSGIPIYQPNRMPINGLKPKDLVGIPWRVAFALQQPFYAGRIKREIDRVWLAAMIEAEGCMFIHRRKEGQHNGQGYYRQNASFGSGLEVANTSEAVVNRCMEIAGIGSICSQGPEQNARRRQRIYRWNVRSNECRWVIQEVYPYLVGKRQQARLVYGCPSSGEKADAAHAAVIGLHNGLESDVDLPEIPSLYYPGYYLRSDIIWSKCNPMPESVQDRPTKAHEYIFLLTKSERYWWDREAVLEPLTTDPKENYPARAHITGRGSQAYPGNQQDKSGGFPPSYKGSSFDRGKTAVHQLNRSQSGGRNEIAGRNIRSVWTIATQPYSGAHFATFPREIPERCIKAGSKPGDVVLDPFCGSGTTVMVAHDLGRVGIGLDLTYQELAAERVGGTLFAKVVNSAF